MYIISHVNELIGAFCQTEQ